MFDFTEKNVLMSMDFIMNKYLAGSHKQIINLSKENIRVNETVKRMSPNYNSFRLKTTKSVVGVGVESKYK